MWWHYKTRRRYQWENLARERKKKSSWLKSLLPTSPPPLSPTLRVRKWNSNQKYKKTAPNGKYEAIFYAVMFFSALRGCVWREQRPEYRKWIFKVGHKMLLKIPIAGASRHLMWCNKKQISVSVFSYKKRLRRFAAENENSKHAFCP